MNDILAGIYGTNGHEKVASANNTVLSSLSAYADAITQEMYPQGADIEKIASAYESVYDQLVYYDVAGRSAAQSEMTALEQSAVDSGDYGELAAFFS